MQYVTAFLAPRSPFLYRIHQWNEETFSVLLGILEWTHLRSKGPPSPLTLP